MNNKSSTRIDKWLWAVRIFKTRSQATDACKKSRVAIEGEPVKPSYSVKIGQSVEVKINSFLTRTFTVRGILEKRVSAKIAVEYVEETTPPEVYEELEAIRNNPFAVRDRGMGRPTKRDRRRTNHLKDIS